MAPLTCFARQAGDVSERCEVLDCCEGIRFVFMDHCELGTDVTMVQECEDRSSTTNKLIVGLGKLARHGKRDSVPGRRS
jgi:hypothetical protein